MTSRTTTRYVMPQTIFNLKTGFFNALNADPTMTVACKMYKAILHAYPASTPNIYLFAENLM